MTPIKMTWVDTGAAVELRAYVPVAALPESCRGSLATITEAAFRRSQSARSQAYRAAGRDRHGRHVDTGLYLHLMALSEGFAALGREVQEMADSGRPARRDEYAASEARSYRREVRRDPTLVHPEASYRHTG